MLFNSLEFLIFFPIVTTLYFLLPQKYRWVLLLMASIIFYMAFIPAYILIFAATILVDYFSGIWMERSGGKKRKYFLWMSLCTTILILFVFKYFNFFNANIAWLADFLDWNYPIEALGIILPIGLSFHTFQGMSYIIEVYWGRQKAEKHFGIYALYVMFYPQLVAGPIERPQNLLHQFYEKHKFEYRRVIEGLKLMAWGMFKKVVIADRLAVLVNSVYGNVYGHPKSREICPEDVYCLKNINSYGDMIGHIGLSSKFSGDALILNKDPDPESLDVLQVFSKKMVDKNIKVFYSYPPLAQSSFSLNEQQINEIKKKILKIQGITILDEPKDNVFSDETFFDTKYHLDGVGRKQRTVNLVQNLSRYMLNQ